MYKNLDCEVRGTKMMINYNNLNEGKNAPSDSQIKLKKEILLQVSQALFQGKDPKELAKLISLDPELVFLLLKYINSAFFSLRKEIKSVESALAYLGYKNLRNYILTLLASHLLESAANAKQKIEKAISRAFLMKNFCNYLRPEHKDEAYLVGLFSILAEELPEEELINTLRQAMISEYVISGLKDNNSMLGSLLSIVKEFEEYGLSYLNKLIEKLGVDKNLIIQAIQKSQEETNELLKLIP